MIPVVDEILSVDEIPAGWVGLAEFVLTHCEIERSPRNVQAIRVAMMNLTKAALSDVVPGILDFLDFDQSEFPEFSEVREFAKRQGFGKPCESELLRAISLIAADRDSVGAAIENFGW